MIDSFSNFVPVLFHNVTLKNRFKRHNSGVNKCKGNFTVYKQFFCYLNFANHITKESFVLAASRSLVGTLMTIGDVRVSIAIVKLS